MATQLNNNLTEALAKLSAEQVKTVTGNKEKAMAGPVAEALRSFCRQNPEFARAVQAGGSFAECMAAVAKGVGNHISDLDAYKRAVIFYFPGADIKTQMSIVMGASDPASEPEKPALRLLKTEPAKPVSLVLNLEDFL